LLLDKHAQTFSTLAQQLTLSDTSIIDAIQSLNDPLFVVFQPIFHFDEPAGLLAAADNENSAIAYLNRIGENSRASVLQHAIDVLKSIQDYAPWSYKEVSGHIDAASADYSEPEFTDNKLEFELYESVDWRISAMLKMFDTVTYNDSRFVEILPRNLQQFSMSLFLSDVRIILADSAGLNFALFGQDSVLHDVLLTAKNHRLLHFGKCRILRSSGQSAIETLSNSEINESTCNIDIEYKAALQSARFNIIAGGIELSSNSIDVARTKVSKFADIGNAADAGIVTNSLLTTPKVPNIVAVVSAELTDLYNQAKQLVEPSTYSLAASGIASAYADSKASMLLNYRKLHNIYDTDYLNILLNADTQAVNKLQNTLHDL
jgi:hypothetical protein